MKFLRVLVNALLSGLFFSLLLTLLIADLNINLKPTFPQLARLVLSIGVFYGLSAVFVSLLLYYFIRFFAGKPNPLAWLSPSFLSISFASWLIPFLVIFRANQTYFSSYFDARMNVILKTQAVVLALLVPLGFLAFYAAHRSGRKASYFTAYFLALVLGMTFLFAERWGYPAPHAPSRVTRLEARKVDRKVFLLDLEGLSIDVIIPLVLDGKLPNFSWLIDGGGWGRLENFSPNEPWVLKNSLETGKFPAKHRQISPFCYRIMNSGDTLEVVPRFILFRQLTRIGALQIIPQQSVSRTKGLWQILEQNGISVLKRNTPAGLTSAAPDPKAEKQFSVLFPEMGSANGPLAAIVRRAFLGDWEYENSALEEKDRVQPQVFHLALDGLSTVETFFYKYSFPGDFGNVDQESIARYGTVIEKYYHFYDQLLGKYLTGLKEDEILVVYSSHGIEPLPLWKRFVEWILGNPEVSAYHEFAPDGAVFFYGKTIARGRSLEAFRLVDIAPTLFYALSLPVGKDMDGIVRSPVFLREFIAENPIFSISSYDEVEIRPAR